MELHRETYGMAEMMQLRRLTKVGLSAGPTLSSDGTLSMLLVLWVYKVQILTKYKWGNI